MKGKDKDILHFFFQKYLTFKCLQNLYICEKFININEVCIFLLY